MRWRPKPLQRPARAATQLPTACLIAALAAGCGGPKDGGPLADPPGSGSASVGVPLKPGQPFTDAVYELRNHGRKPATITAMHFLGRDGSRVRLSIHLAGADRIRTSRGCEERTTRPTCLKPGSVKPVAGFRLDPLSTPSGKLGATVVVTGRAGQRGTAFSYRGFEVDYRVEGQDYRVRLAWGFSACVAPKLRCKPRMIHDIAADGTS